MAKRERERYGGVRLKRDFTVVRVTESESATMAGRRVECGGGWQGSGVRQW